MASYTLPTSAFMGIYGARKIMLNIFNLKTHVHPRPKNTLKKKNSRNLYNFVFKLRTSCNQSKNWKVRVKEKFIIVFRKVFFFLSGIHFLKFLKNISCYLLIVSNLVIYFFITIYFILNYLFIYFSTTFLRIWYNLIFISILVLILLIIICFYLIFFLIEFFFVIIFGP